MRRFAATSVLLFLCTPAFAASAPDVRDDPELYARGFVYPVKDIITPHCLDPRMGASEDWQPAGRAEQEAWRSAWNECALPKMLIPR